MTRIRNVVILGAAFVVGSATPLLASDLLYPPMGGMKDGAIDPMATEIPAPIPIQETASWYLRGDIGYSWYQDPDTSINAFGSDYDVDNGAIESTGTIAVGFGTYVTPHLRGDLTVEYRFESDVTASLVGDIGGTQPLDGTEFNSAGLQTTLALANLYYDFTPYRHFTPYIGAGIGFAYHDLSIPDKTWINTTFGKGTSMQVAFAAMLGMSVTLRDGWMLDAGYRFLYMGDADIDFVINADDPNLSLKDIMAHEVRVGLRYDLF